MAIYDLTNFSWFSGIIDGCHKWNETIGKKAGVDFQFKFLDNKASSEIMQNNIRDLIASSCDGILLFPVDDSTAIPLLKEAQKKGITNILGDYEQSINSPEDVSWSTFVAHNMYELGYSSCLLYFLMIGFV